MKNQWCNIAVIGLSGIFPGAANPEQFCTNIEHKKNAIIDVPENRWVIPPSLAVSPQLMPDKALCSKAGLINRFQFDPSGFQISGMLLSDLDPLLQLSLTAGHDLLKPIDSPRYLLDRTGIILASISLPTDHSSCLASDLLCRGRANPLEPARTIGSQVVSWPAALTARALGLGAGAYTLDAACASSLYAIKLACDELCARRADMMIAGGVSRPDSLYTQIGFSQLQALSPSGVCAPFDRSADGLVVGEGVGMVALKRLDDAVTSGDRILAVITGAGLSNDIEGNLIAPASEGQVRAMHDAYRLAGWTINDVQYIECHGSGTPVGDMVELNSMSTLRQSAGSSDNDLAIGSVKSMTGHLLTAAGAAGFIKTVLAMGRKFLPPSLNFTAPAKNNPLADANMKVQTETQAWNPSKPGLTRKAGVSAFGFGGINAHILLEEFIPESRKIPSVSHPEKDGMASRSTGFPSDPAQQGFAIVGMSVLTRPAPDLYSYDHILRTGVTPDPALPGDRFRSSRISNSAIHEEPGFYLDNIFIYPGEFHIPPNQLEDILPQHLVLLKTVKHALIDAGIPVRPEPGKELRTRFGAAIGIEFDHEATDFHLRWTHHGRNDTIKNSLSNPLTSNRTLGALGGIVASRVAREFKIGGPCFTLSAGALSSVKALEVGMSSLALHQTDLFVCAAVDMAGDIRQALLNSSMESGNKTGSHTVSTILPSEGAAAVIIKRLDQALADDDRIYGIIQSTGSSSAGSMIQEPGSSELLKRQYLASLDQVLATTNEPARDISLIEISELRDHPDGFDERQAIRSRINPVPKALEFSCASKVIGNTYSASGMFSLVSAALRLNQDASSLQRYALVSCLSFDGGCGHILLGNHPGQGPLPIPEPEAPHPQSIPIKVGKWPISEDIFAILNPLTDKPEAVPSMDKISLDPLFDPDIISKAAAMTARAHEAFLDLTAQNLSAMETQLQALAQFSTASPSETGNTDPVIPDQHGGRLPAQPEPDVMFTREQCLEFAVGKAGNVLGASFDIIDTFPVRVRLPDDPLMLVDRILDISGEMGSLTSGTIVTQHDVLSNAWYLDGNRAPVSISIEAGQADLFLCSYLGIDHRVKGKRRYRLLDARVTFHRPLPVPGETIEYHIQIDRFLKQGDVYLFFFHYKGYIGSELFISMRDGCAGFFTPQEVEDSGGIILKPEDKAPISRQEDPVQSAFRFPAPVNRQSFSDYQINALRNGNLEAAFGPEFRNKRLSSWLCLPSGRMHLIDRVLDFDPRGGRYGLGFISAQADITPDKWFLTCHFIDDMVMPGTLMYECCAHALRIFTQRIGWITSKDGVYYDVILNNESDLKCRGPVTPQTRTARYDIEIKQIGYDPEPFVIADAHMFSDDLRIVLYKDMGMRLIGMTREELEYEWRTL